MLTPEKYKLFFYAYAKAPIDPHTGEEKGSGILDAVRWAYVPPPEFTITTEPKQVDMRAGDEEEIFVQINSTTGLQPVVNLTPSIQAKNVSMEITDNNLSLPSFGIATTHLKIKTDENTGSALHRFFLTGNLSFPMEKFTIPINTPAETLGNISIPIDSKNVLKQTSGLLNLQPAFTLSEQFRQWISEWFNPISSVVLTLVSVATGIVGFGIGSKSKRGK